MSERTEIKLYKGDVVRWLREKGHFNLPFETGTEFTVISDGVSTASGFMLDLRHEDDPCYMKDDPINAWSGFSSDFELVSRASDK